MLQLPSTDLVVAPGHAIEWTVRSATGAVPAQAAGPDGAGPRRRPSYNQEFHFGAARQSARASGPSGRPVAGPSRSDSFAASFEIEGPLDAGALEEALLHFVRRHEVLRCVFREHGGALALDVVGPRDVKLERAEVGRIDSPERARHYLRGFLRGTDTLRGPWLVMGAMVRDDSTTVYLACDHIVTDGMSMTVAVHDIATAYAALREGRHVALPEPAGALEHAERERRSSRSLAAGDERLGHWRRFITGEGGPFPPFPLDLGTRPGGVYDAVNETDTLLTAAGADAMEAHCRAAGATFATGVLAAVAVSLRREGGPDVYRGLLPVSTRGRGADPHSMGWFVNILPIEFPVADEHDFDGVLAGAQAASTRMARSLDVPFTEALRLLAPEYRSAPWPAAVNFFSYMDFRKAPGAASHGAWRANFYTSVPRTNGVLLWLHRTGAGLHLNCAFVDTPRARRTKAALVRTLAATVEGIALRGAF
ncbi:condensation domain-containing protein [Kitasatospora sp. NBC_01287]|uniref:condensation domain-containing protein n=1 Tax=Kitasatospora sp. NBC_01287 TaxID=2903573 RepID=UPI0022535981|nr:condensation domain-containing protein [Kitasatospora sp. NBC_01287]MCX4751328.1 condensation domain-containing protein [Kitasatospora sp. NBC_01287]